MHIRARCEVMLPNSTQCPNEVIDMAIEVPNGWSVDKCLLHNQLDGAQGTNNVVDETNENTNSIPADKV